MSQQAARRSPYLVSPLYDWAFFLMPPAIALWVGVMISGTDFADAVFHFAGVETTAAGLFLGAIVHAHLVAVFVRSHANPKIFPLYRFRFVLVPIALFLAIVSSVWIAITVTVVATFWDVWHSGAQTFGFARIYDRNRGVPNEVGRRLDLWANQLLYAGPILAGATLVDHLETFEGYEHVGASLFTSIPAFAGSHQRYLTWAVLLAGTLFIAYYVYAHWRFWRQGHKTSPLKIYLVASTGLCSIYTWGFNSWGEAFFIMNLFHAVQYLALVWATERKHIVRRLRMDSRRRGKQLALVAYLGAVLAYGLGAQAITAELEVLWAVTMVVSIMHFWYDGFIWSVAKKQV